MNDVTVWIIVIAFYAPLHYLLPVLFLFITGQETEDVRRHLIKSALVDATLSMIGAFAAAIVLVKFGWIGPAMLVLLVSMALPFVRILGHRREISQGE
jgi:hypothetical protein